LLTTIISSWWHHSFWIILAYTWIVVRYRLKLLIRCWQSILSLIIIIGLNIACSYRNSIIVRIVHYWVPKSWLNGFTGIICWSLLLVVPKFVSLVTLYINIWLLWRSKLWLHCWWLMRKILNFIKLLIVWQRISLICLWWIEFWFRQRSLGLMLNLFNIYSNLLT
jgi:hypothetical protein